MKKYLYILLSALVPMSAVAYTLNRVSVHDPSIVWDPASNYYYVFGSHRAAAKSKNMMSWEAFQAPWATATSKNAANADAFTTVSEITARECEHFLGRPVDVVTPNGFENSFTPSTPELFEEKRKAARVRLIEVAAAMSGESVSKDAILIGIGGRYEYRNKGIDVFIDALKKEQARTTDLELTEEEMEIYDLLIKDRKLTKAEEQKVILAAKNLYHKLVAEKERIMVIDWYKDEQPKQKVVSLIKTSLNEDLPESYDKPAFDDKTTLLLNHFIDMAVQGYGWLAA